MQVPLQVTCNTMQKSDAVEAAIRNRVDNMARRFENIIGGYVVVDAPLQGQRKGGLFRVPVDITCPEGKVAVNRESPAQRRTHADVSVAIRDAFAAAERLLQHYAARRRGEVKPHEEVPVEAGSAFSVRITVR